MTENLNVNAALPQTASDSLQKNSPEGGAQPEVFQKILDDATKTCVGDPAEQMSLGDAKNATSTNESLSPFNPANSLSPQTAHAHSAFPIQNPLNAFVQNGLLPSLDGMDAQTPQDGKLVTPGLTAISANQPKENSKDNSKADSKKPVDELEGSQPAVDSGLKALALNMAAVQNGPGLLPLGVNGLKGSPTLQPSPNGPVEDSIALNGAAGETCPNPGLMMTAANLTQMPAGNPAPNNGPEGQGISNLKAMMAEVNPADPQELTSGGNPAELKTITGLAIPVDMKAPMGTGNPAESKTLTGTGIPVANAKNPTGTGNPAESKTLTGTGIPVVEAKTPTGIQNPAEEKSLTGTGIPVVDAKNPTGMQNPADTKNLTDLEIPAGTKSLSGMELEPHIRNLSGMELQPGTIDPSGIKLPPHMINLSGMKLQPNLKTVSGMELQPGLISPSGIENQPNLVDLSGMEQRPGTIRASGIKIQPAMISASGIEIQPNSIDLSGMELQPGTISPSGVKLQPEMIRLSGMENQPNSMDLSGMDLQPGTVSPSGVKFQPEMISLSGIEIQTNPMDMSGMDFQPVTISPSGVKSQPETSSLPGSEAQPNTKDLPGIDLQPGVNSTSEVGLSSGRMSFSETELEPERLNLPGTMIQLDPLNLSGMSLQLNTINPAVIAPPIDIISALGIKAESDPISSADSRVQTGTIKPQEVKTQPNITNLPGIEILSGLTNLPGMDLQQTAGMGPANLPGITTNVKGFVNSNGFEGYSTAAVGIQSDIINALGIAPFPGTKNLTGAKYPAVIQDPLGFQDLIGSGEFDGQTVTAEGSNAGDETSAPSVRNSMNSGILSTQPVRVLLGRNLSLSGPLSIQNTMKTEYPSNAMSSRGSHQSPDQAGLEPKLTIPMPALYSFPENSVPGTVVVTNPNVPADNPPGNAKMEPDGVFQNQVVLQNAVPNDKGALGGTQPTAISGMELKINRPVTDGASLGFPSNLISVSTAVKPGETWQSVLRSAPILLNSQTVPGGVDYSSHAAKLADISPKFAPQISGGTHQGLPNSENGIGLSDLNSERAPIKGESQLKMPGATTISHQGVKMAANGHTEISFSNPMSSLVEHPFAQQVGETKEPVPALSSGGGHQTTHEELYPQIIDRARLMVINGQHEMEVSLKPDHLGKIQLKVSLENQQVTAKFMAETQQVKDIIENHLPALRRQLQDTGLQVDVLTVATGGQSGAGQSQQNHNQQPATTQAPTARRPFFEERNPGLEPPPMNTHRVKLSSLVDFVA